MLRVLREDGGGELRLGLQAHRVQLLRSTVCRLSPLQVDRRLVARGQSSVHSSDGREGTGAQCVSNDSAFSVLVRFVFERNRLSI